MIDYSYVDQWLQPIRDAKGPARAEAIEALDRFLKILPGEIETHIRCQGRRLLMTLEERQREQDKIWGAAARESIKRGEVDLESWVRVVVNNNWRGKYREWQRLELLFLEFLTILPEELQHQIKEIRYQQSKERMSRGF